jgi:oxygen-independent coproporphyrinogen-3 oxidase
MNRHPVKPHRSQEPGLYVHIPFCRTKCPYCGFYSIASASPIPRWIGALQKEMDHYRYRFAAFDSLYLGGGTPTCLTTRDLERVMECILKKFVFSTDAEMTLEANPQDLTLEKIHLLRDLEFNRISLGVQSFDDRVLSFLGRRHSAETAGRALRELRSCGFENIGVDLIYGFEELSSEVWMGSLKKALEFSPEHVSCYQLSCEDNTVFGRMRDRGLLGLPGEEAERSFFMSTSEFLEDNGYIHYEISNYAKGAEFVSRHNSKYWRHVPYLGLGPSAHSFDGSRRWWNVSSIRAYCGALEKGCAPVEGDEHLTSEQKILESVSLGLRTSQGVELKEILSRGASAEALSRLISLGFLHTEGERIMPTRRGFLVADYLPNYLMP